MRKYSSFIIILPILLLFLSAAGISYAWDFNIIGTARETFDDNINSTVETLFQKKKYDFISELMVGLGLRHEGKTFTLDLMGRVTQQVYAMNFGLTNNNQDATLSLTKSFSELVTFRITDTFQNFPEPDRFELLFGNTQGRMRYWSNNFTLNGTFEANKHYTINLFYTNRFSKYFYKRTRQWYFNRFFYRNYISRDLKYSHVNTARMQHEIHFDSSNNLYLFYEYQWTNSDPGSILQVHRPGVGYRYDFTKQLFIEGRISPDFVFSPRYTRVNIRVLGVEVIIPPQAPYDISLYAYLLLSHDVDQKTNARLNFTYENSVLANNADPTTNWRIQGDLTRQVFDRLSLTGTAFYGQSYIFASNLTNSLLGFSLLTAYEFTEHISASISYSFTWNTSHVDGDRVLDEYVLPYGSLPSLGSIQKEYSGYFRNRVSIAVNGSW